MTISDWTQKENRARDFYAKFGFAFSEAQILERAVIGVLSAHIAYTKSGRISKNEIAELIRKVEKRTLRPLIEEMKKHFEFSQDDLASLEVALKCRNDLAHGFLWKNGRTMVAPGGLEKLTLELEGITHILIKARRIADAAYAALLKRAGLDRPEYEAAFQEHLRKEYERIQKEE
jgi:hypothetical protein